MNNDIIFEEFPGNVEQRKEKKKRKRALLIILLISVALILSILSTLLNLKILNKG